MNRRSTAYLPALLLMPALGLLAVPTPLWAQDTADAAEQPADAPAKVPAVATDEADALDAPQAPAAVEQAMKAKVAEIEAEIQAKIAEIEVDRVIVQAELGELFAADAVEDAEAEDAAEALTAAEKRAAAQKAAEEKKKQKELTEKERLKKIVLPDNPTREQCEEYVAKLRKHTEGRNSFSSADDEVDKLKAIPLEHVDLILNEMTGRSGLRFYSRYALNNVDLDEHKDKIVARLDSQPNNIIIVVHYGWFQAAKPYILSRLQNADATTEIEPAWFQAFVEVAEPKHHKKLHQIAVNARQIDDFVPLLETLPDYDLHHTVNAAWNTIDKGSRDYYTRRKRETLAPYAARFGVVEALGILIQELQKAPDYNMRIDRVNQERLVITRLIDYRGSDKEIEAWYKENKDDLVFDNFRKKFVVQEGFE